MLLIRLCSETAMSYHFLLIECLNCNTFLLCLSIYVSIAKLAILPLPRGMASESYQQRHPLRLLNAYILLWYFVFFFLQRSLRTLHKLCGQISIHILYFHSEAWLPSHANILFGLLHSGNTYSPVPHCPLRN